eukprot:scaffold30873_cov37-Phaeocystis_antarctica.AAC.1
MNPWRAPGTTRPRQLSQQEPQRAGDLFWEESEAMRATKKEEGRGVRAKACGARAVGYSCGRPHIDRVWPASTNPACREPRRAVSPSAIFICQKQGDGGRTRGRGSAQTSCSWTLGLRWRLPRWLASGTNGAELALRMPASTVIERIVAEEAPPKEMARSSSTCPERRGEQLAGENAGRPQIAVSRRRPIE